MAFIALAVIYLGRRLLLSLLIARYSQALMWIAPRGLITVLLFLHVKEIALLPSYIDGAVLLVVLFSAIAITMGRSSRKVITNDS